MKRNTLFIIVIVVFAGSMLISNFIPKRANYGGSTRDDFLTYQSWLNENYQTPAEYLVNLFAEKDIVLVGDHLYMGNGIDFLNNSLPYLADNGVKAIAIDFALSEDQELIRQLITAPQFDIETAKLVLFRRLVNFGYENYLNLFRAAWNYNQGKSTEQQIRIYGLNEKPDYELIKTQEDLDNPEIIKQVLPNGTTDQVMAKAAMEKVIPNEKKVLFYTATAHAFTEYRQIAFEENARSQGKDLRRMGTILADEYGSRVTTVLVHILWTSQGSRYGVDYPMNGAIDQLIKGQEPDKRKFGFTVDDSPLADIPLTGDYTYKHENLTFNQLTDGYLVLGPFSEAYTLTPIQNFITDDNIEEALRNFPGPDPGDVSVDEFNTYIENVATNFASTLKYFK